MTNVEGTPRTYFGAVFAPASEGGLVFSAQLFVFLALILCSGASAQNKQRSDYIRSSQPPLLKYKELVALNEEETIDAHSSPTNWTLC